jgi:ElaB/YqjD/DUF883 family membrane-anchored ribosome-binding protein
MGADALRRDFDALRSDFTALSKDFNKLRKDGPHEIQEEIEARVDHMKERIERTADSLVSDAEEQIGAARTLFKEHPGAAIGGAFVLGLIAAKFLR